MTWIDYMTARQLLTDDLVGVMQRAGQRQEVAKVEATKAAIRKHEAVNGAS
jgi:hypothetical protein